jgi:mono/diheme cytochrome c family protein
VRHVQIARLTWVLTAVFAGGAVLFAATRPAPDPAEAAADTAADTAAETAAETAVETAAADPEAAAAAFEARCAACHGPREFPYWASLHPDPDARRAWLDGLLQRHYPPPEEERSLVIDHIERALAEGG